MGELSTAILGVARSIHEKRNATGQGGLLTGQDPSAVNLTDPLRLWIIQLGVILLMTQLLSLILGKIRQPKVIAEVIGGILLGPTAFGRIPGFTEHIFPSASISYLSLVADVGLCLFLFLVGLEIDGTIVKRNARLSAIIALAGMAIPFGLGAALSVPLYHTFIDPSVKFTNFMLFTGVAYSITAFPVLCRILTELKLLDTSVGIIVLSAGVGNDIVGWVLLALSVALVNAGSGLTAFWILLVCIGWAILLLFPFRWALHWLARRTGSIENGPTMFFMTVTVLTLFGSAFFTDVIGVQAIFGAFLVGLIVPRDGGLAIALTEKLEDMVSIVFLPLYFTISGLNTNLGLLDNGITWGFTVAICTLAFTGKFGGCTIAARFAGFSWREASTIGSLMSCKGLVELIVLNVGLSAGILSQQVFSMFVLEALLLTFCTTPTVVKLYPPEMRVRVSSGGVPHKHTEPKKESDDEKASQLKLVRGNEMERKTRFMVILDKIEHLPGLMAFTQLLQPPPPPENAKENRLSLARSMSSTSALESEKKGVRRVCSQEVSIEALRLIELSDRTSAVMKSSNADMLINTDSMLSIYNMFGDLHGMPVQPSLAIVPYDDFAASVAEHADRTRSHLVLVPWLPVQYNPEQTHGQIPGTPNPTADADVTAPDGSSPNTRSAGSYNPFEALFRASGVDKPASVLHSHFVRSVFAQCNTDVALFIDRQAPHETRLAVGSGHHLFVPFFGGPDDRLALEFVVQLCANSRVRATVIRFVKREDTVPERTVSIEKPEMTHSEAERRPIEGSNLHNMSINAHTAFPDTVYGHATTQTRLQSETADNVAWNRFAHPTTNGRDQLSEAISRIDFEEVPTSSPLRSVVERATSVVQTAAGQDRRPMIIVGRSRRLAAESHVAELKQLMDEQGGVGNEVKKTVGDVTTALIMTGCKASVVVIQAASATAAEQ